MASRSALLNWIQQGALVPCECKKCYFCLHGHTTGIGHRVAKKRVKVVDDKSNTVGWTEICTKKRLPLGKGSNYCRMCCRKLIEKKGDDGKLLDKAQKKALCKSSTMGCPQCDEPICNVCWLEKYDMHRKRK